MLTDVIAAIATPPGKSAIAMIRISGTGSHDVCARILRPFTSDSPRTLTRAVVENPTDDEKVDDVLYAVFRKPESYTGEDAVEISTHGGLFVPAEVLNLILQAGARMAHPGEFTRRAVLNGKMDLLQAEGVGDLIASSSSAQRRVAINQLDRGLSRRIEELRGLVLNLEKLVCYEIDFPEEDSGPVPPEDVERAIDEFRLACSHLLNSADEGERLRDGAVVVIAGMPNTGKSSLFNALLGMERAIVTELAGTTRDAIEAPFSCDGFPIRLVDTAGLRSTDDIVEQKGIEVSRRYLEGADAVLFCVETGRELADEEQRFLESCSMPSLLVRTKCDMFSGTAEGSDELRVSAATADGLKQLRSELAGLAFGSLAGAADIEPVITRARHRIALERALAEIDDFRRVRKEGLEGAVAAIHLRAAVTSLETLIGVVSQDDVLDVVFASFCIGK